MDFTINTLHKLEEDIQNCSDLVAEKLKCCKLENVSRDLLKSKSVTKDILMDILLNMGPLISRSRSVLRSAIAKLDEQKSELLDNQKHLLQRQNEVINLQKMKLDTVQETVQQEIKTFSDIVKENCSGKDNTVTPENL